MTKKVFSMKNVFVLCVSCLSITIFSVALYFAHEVFSLVLKILKRVESTLQMAVLNLEGFPSLSMCVNVSKLWAEPYLEIVKMRLSTILMQLPLRKVEDESFYKMPSCHSFENNKSQTLWTNFIWLEFDLCSQNGKVLFWNFILFLWFQ